MNSGPQAVLQGDEPIEHKGRSTGRAERCAREVVAMREPNGITVQELCSRLGCDADVVDAGGGTAWVCVRVCVRKPTKQNVAVRLDGHNTQVTVFNQLTSSKEVSCAAHKVGV